MPKEIITIHLGQAGLQMGSAIWELLCLEHNIQPDGESRENCEKDFYTHSLFDEVKRHKFVPRAVMFDMEPTVIDEIRQGRYRQLWNPIHMINGKESSASLFARSYFSQGKEFVNLILESIRKLVNKCESLNAFQFINSFAGGTGSGMGSLLIEKCQESYGKKYRFSLSVFPSARMSEAMVDPYNSILHTNSSMDHIDCSIICDNETLFSKCVTRLHYPSPTFTLINRLFAQMATSVFLSHRFHSSGSQHADVCELLTNLVPYPRIHFPILAMAPITAPGQIDHDSFDVNQLTDSAFLMESQACECDTYHNKYISCAMLYRGNVSLSQVYSSISQMRANRRITFVDWCPTGFKIALNSTPPLTIPGVGFLMPERGLTMVAGNVGIKEAWNRLGLKFDLLYAKRAFIHHFVSEGMEESEFTDARENIATLEKDYTEISADSNEDEVGTDYISREEQLSGNVSPKIIQSPKQSPSVAKQQSQSNLNQENTIFASNFSELNRLSNSSINSQEMSSCWRKESKNIQQFGSSSLKKSSTVKRDYQRSLTCIAHQETSIQWINTSSISGGTDELSFKNLNQKSLQPSKVNISSNVGHLTQPFLKTSHQKTIPSPMFQKHCVDYALKRSGTQYVEFDVTPYSCSSTTMPDLQVKHQIQVNPLQHNKNNNKLCSNAKSSCTSKTYERLDITSRQCILSSKPCLDTTISSGEIQEDMRDSRLTRVVTQLIDRPFLPETKRRIYRKVTTFPSTEVVIKKIILT